MVTEENQGRKYVCLSCFTVFTSETETHCPQCNSDSVISGEDLTKYAPASGSKSPRPKVEHTWYRIYCGPFETVVSYIHASNLDEALKYAESSYCEWYLTGKPEDWSMTHIAALLNHEQFNQWCAKMWPVFRPTTTDESTS